MTRWRWLAVVGVAVMAFGLSVGTAGAAFDQNTIGCSGHALITADSGRIYPVDASATEAKVPRDGTVEWSGEIGTVTHDHSGEVTLKFALWDVSLGSWGPSANSSNLNTRAGTKEVPSAIAQIPAGKYVVSGFHEGKEGRCSGSITVEVEGSPFSNIVGISGMAGTILAALGLAVASRARPLR